MEMSTLATQWTAPGNHIKRPRLDNGTSYLTMLKHSTVDFEETLHQLQYSVACATIYLEELVNKKEKGKRVPSRLKVTQKSPNVVSMKDMSRFDATKQQAKALLPLASSKGSSSSKPPVPTQKKQNSTNQNKQRP